MRNMKPAVGRVITKGNMSSAVPSGHFLMKRVSYNFRNVDDDGIGQKDVGVNHFNVLTRRWFLRALWR